MVEEVNEVMKSTIDYYTAWADDYEKFYDQFLILKAEDKYREGYEKVAQVLWDTAKSGHFVIDIGCGVGRWSVLLTKKGAHVAGLDISLKLLKKCKKRSTREDVKHNVFPVQGDGFHLPFRDDAFDGATLNWFIAHIPHTRSEEFLREVKRVVRRDGWLIISDSYWRGQDGGKEQVQTRLAAGKQYRVYKYYYAPKELKELLEKTFGEVGRIFTTAYEQICVVYQR